MEEVRSVLCDMPATIKAYTIKDKDDFYTIVLNQNLSYEQNLKSYCHELSHIRNNDFDKKNVSYIEFLRHKEDLL